MVTLLELDGSMPSVFRARGSVVLMTMPQTVNPFPRSYITWKLGEVFSVTFEIVKSSDRLSCMRRGQLCERLRTFASCARSHHDESRPASLAHPRPSIVPGPMAPAPRARSPLISARQ